MTGVAKERFEQYIRDMDAELVALEEVMRAQQLPLDRSYESLDRLEDYYGLVLDGRVSTDVAVLETRLGRYVGTALAAHAGGTWDYARNKVDLGKPCITNLPGLGKSRFFPMRPVLVFKRTRRVGWLRDATEIYDLVHRRAQVARLLASVDAEVGGLREDMRELTSAYPDLDFSVESVPFVERAVQALISHNSPREQRRRVRTRAVLYLGTIVQRALGGGAWTLCEDPDDEEFGEIVMHDWAPITAIRATAPHDDGHLRRAIEFVIRSRLETS
jgi:hypothetical protein